ncbi:alpha/beta-hydrolase [Leucogyrophana mollusca]|uniref:Alpha/beta-hydrolase n=1 Tax=Leucogyrophana mollusca TaxID=85980 RepID=A0ACB8BB23_9AGAM|nr:alpha/beta-hydrolase [Leucogyrophana mollusca]
MSVSNADQYLIPVSPNLSLHVETTGPATDNTPIVFIHGLGGSSTNYGPIIDASGVSANRQVITFDLEGHGLSPGGGETSIEGYAQSVKLVMDSQKVEKAVIVGHSMGGIIATTFAAQYPPKVEKLVLIGPVKAFAEAGVKALTARGETVLKGGISAIADTVATAGVSQKTLTSRPLSKHAVRASLLATSVVGYASACFALTRAKDPDYAKITAPTLIIAGTEDKTCPEATVKFLESKIAGARVVTLSDVGHWHLLEDVDAVGEILAAVA